MKSVLWVLTILYSERQNWLKGLYVIICMNPFFFGYVLFQHDVKYETSSMSLGCLYKPGNDELNYFDAAGLWDFFVKDSGSPKGCDFFSVPLSAHLTGSTSG